MDMCVCAEKNRWSQHETVFPAGKLALEKPKSNYGITPETYWLRMNVISLNDSQSFISMALPEHESLVLWTSATHLFPISLRRKK